MPAICDLFLIRYPRVRYILSWSAALVGAAIAIGYAWHWGDYPARRDGNYGHATIDFGGQWVMGRMIATGRGRHLFHRNHLRTVVEEAYPREDEDPKQELHDAEDLLVSLMGEDNSEARVVVGSFVAPLATREPIGASALFAVLKSKWSDEFLAQATAPAIGGALYPPVHAVLHYPLGLLTPRRAYRLMQLFILGLLFVNAGLVWCLLEKRVWYPLILLGMLFFPGYGGAINLGQNAVLSLTLLLAGWFLMIRGQANWGGACWGLLAFKPVWALAFIPALPLMGRWRAFFAMGVTGVTLILVTLPLVGLGSWWDWLAVGQMAATTYNESKTWIFLSRDLLSIPKRVLLHFDKDWSTNPHDLGAKVVSLALWLGVAGATVLIALLRRPWVRMPSGVGPAFVLLGAWLSCYHFMYYDVYLAILPCCLIFNARFHWAGHLIPLVLIASLTIVSQIAAAITAAWQFPPFDTFGLLLLWAWCGWRMLTCSIPIAALPVD
jgi:hypothetical protein